jgi:hypothetical protein
MLLLEIISRLEIVTVVGMSNNRRKDHKKLFPDVMPVHNAAVVGDGPKGTLVDGGGGGWVIGKGKKTR